MYSVILIVHMKDAKGSCGRAKGSSAYARKADAMRILLVASVLTFILMSPHISNAEVVWQSASSGPDSLQVYTPTSTHSWFGLNDNPSVFLGTWSGQDFTTDVSTTLHLLAQWNGGTGNVLDVILQATSGGDPFYGTGTTTAHLVASPGNYYPLAVTATTSLTEYSIPTNPGETVHMGNEMWAFLDPSYSGYTADHWVGASGTTPFLEICENGCAVPSAPTSCVSGCDSNVLFIPGLEGSRLYEKTVGIELQLWEPWISSLQQDAKAMYLNPNGTSINAVYTKTGATIDQVGVPFDETSIYQSFLAQLAGLKASSTIYDYLAFPYDWRQSPEDVVNDGTPYDDGTHFIDQALIALASTSKTGKVTIVAHSNGGLVAKALMIKLQQEGKANLVDKVILVDVPQDGTPMAIAAMLHGDYDPLPGFVVSQQTMRGLAENMPDAYDLLPSSDYFVRVASPVVDLTLDPDLKDAGNVPSLITNANDLGKFLTSGRTKPAAGDIETPDLLSSALLSSATALHSDLDSWTPPVGVQVIQIAGWGLDTPSGVTYQEENISTCNAVGCSISTTTRHAMNITEDGDDTVVVPSQIATTSWQSYYINLPKYNEFFKTNLGHKDVTETSVFQTLFASILSSSSVGVLPQYVTTTEPTPTLLSKTLRLRVLSPVTLDAYDSLGNHTGMIPNPNPQSDDLYVQEQIPNSYYRQYGEGQYIGLPDDSNNYKVVLHGTGTGTFTFEVTPVVSGVAQSTISFAGVPVTASSTATIQVNASNLASTALAVDEDGDGKVDIVIASSTQTTDPLSYTKLIGTTILGMDMGSLVKLRLEAKFVNVGYLITKDTKWDTDDDDSADNSNDRLKDKIIRKLNRIEAYIENENTKPLPKKPPQVEKITSAEASQLLDMIEELKVLINTKI